MDLLLVLGMAGVLVGLTARKLGGQPLVPINDPLLDKCLAHKNA
jgi:hypothetical protein